LEYYSDRLTVRHRLPPDARVELTPHLPLMHAPLDPGALSLSALALPDAAVECRAACRGPGWKRAAMPASSATSSGSTAVVSDRFMTRYPMAIFDARLRPLELLPEAPRFLSNAARYRRGSYSRCPDSRRAYSCRGRRNRQGRAAALKATNEAFSQYGGGWWPTRGSF
jgi:hypothetical protein